MTVRNSNGTVYQTSSLNLLNPNNPNSRYFNEIDQEVIRLSGSPLLYHELFIPSSTIDMVWMESRGKMWSQFPIEIFSMYEPIPSMAAQGLFGIDSPDQMTFLVNYQDTLNRIGHLPTVGARIKSPQLNEDWVIEDRKLAEFKIWKVFHIEIYCKRFQESLTTGEGQVNNPKPTPDFKIEDEVIRISSPPACEKAPKPPKKGSVTLLRATTDIPKTTESVKQIFAGLRETGDAPNTSENAIVRVSTLRTTIDTPSISESAIKGQSPIANEAVSVNGLITRTFVGFRTTTDVPTTSESATGIGSHPRTTTDIPNTSEVATRTFVGFRTTTDIPTTSESATGIGSHPRTTTDIPNTSEVATRTFVGFRTTIDTPSISESAIKGQSPIANEAVSVNGLIIRTFVGFRTTTDVPTTSESATGIGSHPRTTTDIPTTSESATGIGSHPRTTTDIPTTSESATGIGSHPRTTADVPTTSESATGIGSHPRTTTDIPNTSEVATRTFVGFRTTIDVPVISDAADASILSGNQSDIELGSGIGRIALASGDGSLALANNAVSDIELESGSGNIELESGSGNVALES